MAGRTVRIGIRLTQDEAATFAAEAAARGIGVGTWLRLLGLTAAASRLTVEKPDRRPVRRRKLGRRATPARRKR